MSAKEVRTPKEVRDQFRTESAPKLVEAVAGRPVAFKNGARQGTRLSEWLAYFEDEESLFVATGPGKHHLALAHGIHQANGKRLILIMPQEESTTAKACAPWLARNIALWTYRDGGKVSETHLDKERSKDAARKDVVEDECDLGDRSGWTLRIVELASQKALTAAHRQSYQAWHWEGRQVLKIRPRTKRLGITAGVDYSDPSPERPEALTFDLEGPATDDQLKSIEEAVDRAVAARKEGRDTANEEHLLQHWLREHPDALGLAKVVREVPTTRGGKRAYIDLLGVDRGTGLHVIETKIGTDCAIVLQALEYWVWAHFYLDDLARIHGTSQDPPRLDFVVQRWPRASRELFDRYSCSLAESLDPAIPWRLSEVSPKDGGFEVVAFPDRTVR